MTRPLAVAFLLLAAAAAPAAPRDEALRLAPTDAAVVMVLQNARAHVQTLAGSPFALWLPTSTLGKKLFASPELKQVRESTGMIFSELGTSPEGLLEDVFGEAVVFAFTPGPGEKAADERAVLIIRPRKAETISRLIDRLNELQKRTGEIKDIVRKSHREATYFERQKAGGGSEFYCFRGDTFVFTGSEAEIKAAIERDQSPNVAGTPPELVRRMTSLGVADAATVLLINPRRFDADLKAHLEKAKPEEKRFLTRFAEVWAALDQAAVYVTLDKDLELGVSVRFREDKIPADLKRWVTGQPAATAKELIPERTLFGLSGHVRARELIELIASVAPLEPGKPDVKSWIEGTLGPIVGRDQLPRVIDALGPNWAVWAEPPAKDDVLPVFVGAVELRTETEAREGTEKALLEALEFGFKTARVAYNATHPDQIEVRQGKDPRTGNIITSLVNDKGFPAGFRPSFAIINRYLVVATSPDAIRHFNGPAAESPRSTNSTRLAWFSATETRSYLLSHGPRLAKLLAERGIGAEKSLAEQFASLADVLELIDTADITLHRTENGLRIAARVTFAKPLK